MVESTLPGPVVTGMRSVGWMKPGSIAMLRSFEEEELAAWWQDMCRASGDKIATEGGLSLEPYRVALGKVIDVARGVKLRVDVVSANQGYPELLAGKADREPASGSGETPVRDVPIPPVGTRTGGKWPTSFRRQVDQAADGNERKRLEEAEKQRWTGELVKVLEEARLPIIAAAEGSLNRDRRLRRSAKGSRGSTLKKRVREWQRFRRWLMTSHMDVWPRSAEDFLEYLETRAEEPCGRSCLRAAQAAFDFIEIAGEVPEGEKMARSPAVENVIKDLQSELTGTAGRLKKKAPLIFKRVMISLELTVSDREGQHTDYVRCLAWYRLVRIWGSMRFDDTRGLPPDSLVRTGRGLKALLERTKTTGASKAVECLEVFISVEAYIINEDWLFEGFELWKKVMVFPRDYMLPLPNDDYTGVVKKQALYSDAASLSRALFRTLRAPYYLPCGEEWRDVESERAGRVRRGRRTAPEEKEWSLSRNENLFHVEAIDYLKEHGDRALLRSWAEGLMVSKSDCDKLGRWSPKGSEEYVRGTRRVVEQLQELIARAMRADPMTADIADEDSSLEGLRLHMEKKGTREAVIQDQLRKLKWFGARSKIPVVIDLEQAERVGLLAERSRGRLAGSGEEASPITPVAEEAGAAQGSEERAFDFEEDVVIVGSTDDKKESWAELGQELEELTADWGEPEGGGEGHVKEEENSASPAGPESGVPGDEVEGEGGKEREGAPSVKGADSAGLRSDEDGGESMASYFEERAREKRRKIGGEAGGEGGRERPKEDDRRRKPGYVISITGHSHFRRLHFVGRCWRVPGVDYAQYEWHGDELPGPQSYHRRCRDCWKAAREAAAGAAAVSEALAEGSEGDSSSSGSGSDDSTVDEAP